MGQQCVKDLSYLNIDKFLRNGQIIQKFNSNTLYLGQGESENELDDYFFQLNFYKSGQKLFGISQLVKTTVEEFIPFISDVFDAKTKLIQDKSFDDEYFQDVGHIKDLFQKHIDLKKLVSVTRKTYQSNGIHPLSRIEEFTKLNGSLYGHWKDGKGILGVSPEPIVINENGKYLTRSLAGTISTDIPGFETMILNDLKEINEHDLVIKDLTEKLYQYDSKPKVESKKIITFNKIAHICSEISFDSNNRGVMEMAYALSPSAALGAYPSESLSLLKDLNYYKHAKDYRIFGGVFGISHPEIKQAFVMIRNVIWDAATFEINSGSGIVGESEVDKELKEVQFKRGTIEQCFL